MVIQCLSVAVDLTGINTLNVSQKANGVDPGQIAWEQSIQGTYRLKKSLQKKFSRRQKQANFAERPKG